ncbi:MAG: DUF6011 domain-containing protein [Tissierellaceae bacterium]|nr:DUF6011 domain-containing protein [Tissierellaceae bacterium]
MRKKVVMVVDTPNQNYSIPQEKSSRMDICKRCGRKLKNPESIEMGFGKICYQKFMAESLLKPLFVISKKEKNK